MALAALNATNTNGRHTYKAKWETGYQILYPKLVTKILINNLSYHGFYIVEEKTIQEIYKIIVIEFKNYPDFLTLIYTKFEYGKYFKVSWG